MIKHPKTQSRSNLIPLNHLLAKRYNIELIKVKARTVKGSILSVMEKLSKGKLNEAKERKSVGRYTNNAMGV